MSTTLCPNCGVGVPDGVEKCPNCGARVEGPIHSSPTIAFRTVSQRKSEASSNDATGSLFNSVKRRPVDRGQDDTQSSTSGTNGNNRAENPLSAQRGENDTVQSEPMPVATKKRLLPAQSLALIRAKLLDIQKQINNGTANKYFSSAAQKQEEVLAAWSNEVQRTLAFADLLENSKIESQLEEEIRASLTEAVRQLDFARAYEVKFIGHTGAGKSTLLGAIVGEDIFPRRFGNAVTAVPTKVRICEDNEEEKMDVFFLDESRATEKYLRPDWTEMALRYIAEPINEGMAQQNQAYLVKSVEFALHAGSPPILPPNTVLVDLPGGQADEERHEKILERELDTVDAVVIIIGGNRFNSTLVRGVLKQVRSKITESKREDIASRMMFLVATHWDGTNNAGNSPNAARQAVQNLLDAFPPGYAQYHKVGPDGSYFFYPLRARDAFYARMGILGRKLDQEQQGEADAYVGSILSVYSQLQPLVSQLLPPRFEAEHFQEVSSLQHQAMLEFTGFQQLVRDIQNFLSESRQEVQLEQAKEQLRDAMQHLSDFCWLQVDRYMPIGVHNLALLDQRLHTNQTTRDVNRQREIRNRIANMVEAWKTALDEFGRSTDPKKNSNSLFHQELLQAHERAVQYVRFFLEKGRFDDTLIAKHTLGGISTDTISHRAELERLLGELRAILRIALEEEMQSPADRLAQAFLTALQAQEGKGKALNIEERSFEQIASDSEIVRDYNKMKSDIRSKAQEGCLSITVSALLGNTNALTEESPSVIAFRNFESSNREHDDVYVKSAYPYIEGILNEMSSKIVNDTVRAIYAYFRYELDRLLEYKKFHRAENQTQPDKIISEDGEFKILTERINFLLGQLLSEKKLDKQLDAILNKNEGLITQWSDRIRQVETIRAGMYVS